MWLMGQIDWYNGGYSIGTPVLGMCLNIANNGNITIPYNLKTPASHVDIISGTTSDYILLDDNVLVTGYLNSARSWDSGSGSINLVDTTAKYSCWQNVRLAAPSFTTRSVGTKLVLCPLMSNTTTDYDIGVGNNYLWYSTADVTTGHRWYCGTNQVMELVSSGVVISGKLHNSQTTHTASTTAGTTTLTIAHLIHGIYQITQTASVLLTIPTGTSTHAGIIGGSVNNMAIDQSIDWSTINSGSSLVVATVQNNIAHTLIGAGIVEIGISARFRTRLSAQL